jgi:elongation factor 1-alpha
MPASSGEFEASMSKYSSTRSQILLAYTMGIEYMIVVVNKMDTSVPSYSEERFNEIQTEVLSHLKKIGYQPQNIIFIPISAWVGDNLIEPSNNMSWFKGHTMSNSPENTIICKTLLEALDNIVVPLQPVDKPLRLILHDIYKTEDAETIHIGCVETGILKPGMTVKFTPSNLSAQVKTIQMHYKTLEGEQNQYCKTILLFDFDRSFAR